MRSVSPSAFWSATSAPALIVACWAGERWKFPALASAVLVKCWSGLRPATPDGLPFIGPVPGWDNVFVATGHFRAGVQLSIGTAQAVAELFTGKPTCVPLDAFAVDRKPAAGGKTAFRS